MINEYGMNTPYPTTTLFLYVILFIIASIIPILYLRYIRRKNERKEEKP